MNKSIKYEISKKNLEIVIGLVVILVILLIASFSGYILYQKQKSLNCAVSLSEKSNELLKYDEKYQQLTNQFKFQEEEKLKLTEKNRELILMNQELQINNNNLQEYIEIIETKQSFNNKSKITTR